MALTLTRHNGRSGKHGVYNPKHNDRSFDVGKSDHIDKERAKRNVYWDCLHGLHGPGSGQALASFEDVEKEVYHLFYHEATEAQNERNIKNRHPERNRTPEDLLQDKRTCPEETIYQIGSMEESVPPEVLAEITAVFFSELDKRYGEHFHILDWSLHLDEATPHIHERHVFDCEDSHGFRFPQQEKALEKMGIELPDPSKPKGKNNNRKMTFDKMCRELFLDICENHALYLQREPTSGGRAYMEKQDYIIAQQKRKLAEMEAALEAAALKLEDVETISAEISEAAYEKAVEVVTETVQAETVKADLDTVSDYQKWVTSPARGTPESTRSLIGKALDTMKVRIRKAAAKVLETVRLRLHEPAVQEANAAEIKTVAKESLLKKLKETQERLRTENTGTSARERKREARFEH
ncbi:MAG: plasmid recombination protein [Clostridium sp.]|nr:plasmid recombination protein [Clostridium sp.]